MVPARDLKGCDICEVPTIFGSYAGHLMLNLSETGLEAQCPYEPYRKHFPCLRKSAGHRTVHLDSCPCVGLDTAGEFAGSDVKREGDTQWCLCSEGGIQRQTAKGGIGVLFDDIDQYI